jgi:hypothetical protein
MNAIWTVLGDQFRDQLENPDHAQESENRRLIVDGAKEALQLRADDEKTRVMVVGKAAWPMPIPIVKGDKGWYFDVGAGADEILARRIGANELATISNLRAYVDAQVQYASEDRDGDGVLEYAQKINSTPGKKDGLYWEVPAGSTDEASPFGPFLAEKAAYLSDRESGDPFMGYYYRIVTRQGGNAPGGRYDYVINGNMIAGFAIVAWPADYANSGVGRSIRRISAKRPKWARRPFRTMIPTAAGPRRGSRGCDSIEARRLATLRAHDGRIVGAGGRSAAAFFALSRSVLQLGAWSPVRRPPMI